jgi:hypothetical protein
MKPLKEYLSRWFEPGPGGASAVFVALFAAALAAYAGLAAAPGVFDFRYSLYLDSSSFYWIQALWDRTLFPGDPLAAFYSSQLFRPGPEAFWVWVTALFMKTAPYTVGLKALAVLACAAAALMVRRLALVSPARPAAGAAAVLFATLFLSMDTFFGAPRVYGALTVIGFAWAAESRRFLLLPALTALCFAVYPAASAGLAAACALAPFFFWADFSARRLWPRYLAALASGAAACALLISLSALINNASPESADLKSFESAKFYQMVPATLNPFDPADAAANFVLNLNEHGHLYMVFMTLLALVYGLGLLVRPGRPVLLPRSLLLLLGGCGAAFLALYPLHPVTASRQLVLVVPLALVFLGAEGLYTVLGERLRPAAAAAACGALFACLHPYYNEMLSMRRYAGAYEFLSGTSRGSVAAGYPESHLTFTVPVFAVRPVFMSAESADQELLFAYSQKEYAARRRALLAALYCVPGAAARLGADYGVDWLLAEKVYYTPEFLDNALGSPVPSDRETAALLAGAPAPAACYEAHRSAAAFYWKNKGSEGVIVPLRAGGSK